jgi:hypothetical protein
MDTNKILFIVLGLIIFMVIINHIVIITPIQTQTQTQTQVVPVPVPVPVKPIGGCAGTRYGCCPNGTTPKANFLGSNC